MEGGGDLLVAKAGHAVRLAGAHLLEETAVGVGALVVQNAADGVDEVGFFALEVLLQEEPVPGDGPADELSQQGGGGLQQAFAAGGEAVVDEAGHKAHALGLAFFADGVVDPGAIELVQAGGKGPHVRAGGGAPAEDGGEQRVGGGGLPPQGDHELGGEKVCLEFLRREMREEHAAGELRSGHSVQLLLWNRGFAKAVIRFQVYTEWSGIARLTYFPPAGHRLSQR